MLDDKTVKAYLEELGYASVKSFQLAVMYPKYVDGKYGQQTENALISAINVKRNTKNFSVKEFRCECGGKYCCGYPSTLKVEMLRNLQSIRDHYGRPITVTCGLRDKTYNSKLGGSIQNSLHLSGRAVDFYQKGVTDTLANRKRSIKWIKTLPNHHYTYGNGINSYGNGVSAPYMGNALHTDVYVKVSPYDPNGKLIVDGNGGTATVKETQRFLGTPQDGIISGQNKSLKKYYPSLTAVEFGKGGSTCVKYLQKWLGVSQDGIIGQGTVKAWQKKIGVTSDGIFGTASMKAWQKYLNEHDKAVYPVTPSKPTVSTNAQKIVAKAKEYAWAYGTTSSKYSYSKGSAKSAYKTALKKYMGKTAKVSQSDCGYFVSTCVRASGVASSFLALKGTTEAFPSVPSTMKIVHKGKKIPDGLLQAGDIIRYKKTNGHQHTLMCYGNGKIAEAGRENQFPAIEKDTKKYNKSNVKTGTLQVIRAK